MNRGRKMRKLFEVEPQLGKFEAYLKKLMNKIV